MPAKAVLIIALFISFQSVAKADGFSFTGMVDEGTLNPNFSTHVSPGYGVSYSGRQAFLSESQGNRLGFSNIYTNFQLIGDFSVTVQADRSQNPDASSGLVVYFPPQQFPTQYGVPLNFADVYFIGSSWIFGNVSPNCCTSVSNSSSVASFEITRTGSTLTELYNSGNGWVPVRSYTSGTVSGPANIGLFLLQEGGSTNFNQVGFQNFSISADGAIGIAPVPEPSSVLLFSFGLLLLPLLEAYSRRQ